MDTDLPEHFAPPEMWSEYGALYMPRGICAREEVPGPPKGVRWGVWPLYFEEYVGDEEPDLSKSHAGRLAYPRFVAWKRVRRSAGAPGWHMLSRRPWRLDGYIELGEEYRAGWQKQARRDLRLWQEQFENQTHRIEEITLDEFRAAYARSTVRRKVGFDPLEAVERKIAAMGMEHAELWGVRDTRSKKVIAGIALRFAPSRGSATYECPFILPEARGVYAMTALIDHWFARSRARGMTLLVLNSFWQPGEPRAWRAFSLFKSHFGPRYAAYPPVLWRFVWGKIL